MSEHQHAMDALQSELQEQKHEVLVVVVSKLL